MKIKPLLAALILGSTALTAAWTIPAFAEDEFESTAPGIYEGIPEVEPSIENESQDIGPLENDPSEFGEIESNDSFESNPIEPSTPVARPERIDPKTFNKSEKKLAKAIRTLEDFMGDPDTKIAADLLSQSEGILIIPDIVQAGFFLGGRGGTGVLMLRNDDNTWSNPAFVSISGGSVGLQFGAKSSDLVLIFPRRSMVHQALTGSYKLGGNVSGAAGSIAQSPVRPSRGYSKDKIYAISRSSGLYGGVSLEGSELNFSRKRNREFYGADLTPRQIFSETPYTETPRMVPPLRELLTQVETGTYRLF